MPITVVTGPPCAGKSTHIAEHRDPADLVIDLDALAHALGYPADHLLWDDTTPHAAATAARAARTHVLSLLKAGAPLDRARVWVVDTDPHAIALRIYRRTPGTQLLTLDPGRDACRARAVAAHRPPATLREIDRWYARRAPAPAPAAPDPLAAFD